VDPIVLVVLLMFYLPIRLVLREARYRESAAYWREHGVVVVRARSVQCSGAVIGRYMDSDIHEWVRFKMHTYRFDHVVDPSRKEMTGAGELYLEPGLVYSMKVTESRGERPAAITSQRS
jgi:hypothetical protein